MRLLSLAVVVLFSVSSYAGEKKPPNIVFIFSDDHAQAAISAYGDSRKLLQTPNLDRIAKEGMRFDRCLVTNSICGPSRATILTGKHSHLNGFYNNTNSRFDGTQVTFPKLLQANGYQTALVGKWHLVSDPTGFDYWNILPGQGAYYNPAMIRMGKREMHQGYVSDLITADSIEWLDKRDPKKPFLLMCQHKAPHREWEPALKYLGHDQDRQYPEPETLFDDYTGRGVPEKTQDMTIDKTMTQRDLKFVTPGNLTTAQQNEWDKYYKPRNENFKSRNLSGKDLIRWKYNRYMHDYLGCIKSVDESVGEILNYLDKNGLSENTIVVYSSDQGFYLGEHGWFDKRWFYEESLSTPLLVRWPGVTKPGSVNQKIVSNLDFAETFLAAANVAIPSEMQGRSLVPLLKGETPQDWRKSFYYHYYEYPGPHSVRKHYGVITDQYKLVYFYEPEINSWTLIDRKKDPQELKNEAENPIYREIRTELETELKRLRVEFKCPEQDAPESLIVPKKPQPKKK